MALPFRPSIIKYKFYGVWAEKYWKNIPGPFYSTTMNMSSLLAFGDCQEHLIFDQDCEFVWRQPEGPEEFENCLAAMNVDEMGSYQTDGDKHWTPELVRSWWQRRNELVLWAKANINSKQGYEALRKVSQYIQYIESGAEDYLRRYIFFLEMNRLPAPEEKLPVIEINEAQ